SCVPFSRSSAIVAGRANTHGAPSDVGRAWPGYTPSPPAAQPPRPGARHLTACLVSVIRDYDSSAGLLHESGAGEEAAVMTRYAALLRGINVAGHAKVAMPDLRDLLSGLGFVNPRTLLQSGNVVFEADGKTAGELERLLEQEAARRLELRTDFLVRTAAE